MTKRRVGRKAVPLHEKLPRDVDDWLCQKCGRVKTGESTWAASGSVLAANLGCVGNVCPTCLKGSETTPHPEAAEQGLSIGANGGLTITAVPKPVTLVHADGRQYDFRPQPDGETVHVNRVCGRDVRLYPLPTEEARTLWSRLRRQGFEAW